ncbi:outer membrane protein [Enterovirga aerilata]|uniref:Porin family protein n=1 Tax=Enterovirga aerilata TaxID=2730920 RepID=A0A849IAN9_9HYPH|nr:outer membrane beta-barrel protein [Enterovirga sp. DB1703]NNM74468.1 porin family protein [Enterovirga sp. DB1703]
MGSLKLYASVAGFLAVAASSMTAQAADLLPPPPMPEPFEAPAPFAGGWYLRGDIGFSNQSVDRISNPVIAPGTTLTTTQKGFDAAPFGGVGVGYKFNDWLRFDVTGEYRGRSNYHGYDSVSTPGIFFGTNQTTTSKSEWVGLANVYFDLGTWYGFTPFIGAGVGFAHNTLHDYRDVGVSFVPTVPPGAPVGLGLATARDHAETNFAWAVHAGVAYAVSPNFSIEFAYRYLNLGDARSGIIVGYDGTTTPPTRFHDIDSHDFKVGFRYLFADAPAYEHPPLIRKY